MQVSENIMKPTTKFWSKKISISHVSKKISHPVLWVVLIILNLSFSTRGLREGFVQYSYLFLVRSFGEIANVIAGTTKATILF